MSEDRSQRAAPNEGAASPRVCPECGEPPERCASPRRPATPDEFAAVDGFVAHMVYHPEHLYDHLTVVELRDRIDTYLFAWREGRG